MAAKNELKEKMLKHGKGFKYKSKDEKGNEVEMEVSEIIDLGEGSFAVVANSVQPIVEKSEKEGK